MCVFAQFDFIFRKSAHAYEQSYLKAGSCFPASWLFPKAANRHRLCHFGMIFRCLAGVKVFFLHRPQFAGYTSVAHAHGGNKTVRVDYFLRDFF